MEKQQICFVFFVVLIKPMEICSIVMFVFFYIFNKVERFPNRRKLSRNRQSFIQFICCVSLVCFNFTLRCLDSFQDRSLRIWIYMIYFVLQEDALFCCFYFFRNNLTSCSHVLPNLKRTCLSLFQIFYSCKIVPIEIKLNEIITSYQN